MSNGKPTWLLLLLCAPLVCAQQIDVENSPNREVQAVSLFDEIQDAQERSAFRELWQSRDPAKQREQALRFITTYPRSALLKEAYEIVARASVALGNESAGLEWSKRSLRLLPENPFLLALAANLAAKQGQYQWAAASARQALNYLDRAAAPASLTAAAWPGVHDGLRETAYFALGRAAGAAGKYREGEKWLMDALRLNAADYQALYALGIVRAAAHDDDGAAACFAKVMDAATDATSAPLAEAARLALRRIYDRQPHAASTFDEFKATRKWQPPAALLPPPKKVAADRYAGSSACLECHSSESASWRETGMAKMLRPYREDDVIGDFSGKEILAGSAHAVQRGDRRFIELRDQDAGSWKSYPVDFLIGSKWQQAYASKLASGDVLVLPIQYSRVEGTWVNYWKIVDGVSARSNLGHFQGTPDGALYQRDCAPCHTSQLRYPSSIAPPATASFLEGGVDCEMCHGPSLAHVESARSGGKGPRPAADPPIDFKRLAPEESVAICAQCHMQSAIHEPEISGAVNFAESATPFYRTYSVHLLSDFTRKAFFADGRFRATTFIAEAFMRSRCFREGSATCVSCHSPHSEGAAANPTWLKFAEDSDEMCIQCHASLRQNPERHTRHAAGTEAGRCVACHMPRTMDALLFRARSHQIDEIPDAQMTARFGQSDSPNACLICHRDQDAAWLTRQLSAWRDKP